MTCDIPRYCLSDQAREQVMLQPAPLLSEAGDPALLFLIALN